MKSILILILMCSYCALYSQSDTSSLVKQDSTVVTKFSRHPYPGTSNVCRNDTVWLYDWQYDSTKYYRSKYNGMSIWGTGPSADTLIHFGKEDWYTSDFYGWAREWIIYYDDCSYNYIYYNTGELHLTFNDRGEGHYGEFKEYHKNGKLKCTGGYCEYELGLRNGDWKWYDEQGNLVETKNYNCGRYCSAKDRRRPRIFYPPRLKFDY